MKSSFFVFFALVHMVIAGIYVHQQQTYQEQKKNIEHCKGECEELEQRAHALMTQLNTIRERSNLEAYARNELGMQAVRPDQVHTLYDNDANSA